jgi:endonuclease/exonuclease/phosphatase family metal-dependent hydrolase
MTYNVHSFIGTDGVYDPERIARVIELGAADVVALQEVDFGRGQRGQPAAIERLAARLGMRCHFTHTREGRNGQFGNAVLSAHQFHLVAEGLLPRRRGEARAVQWLQVLAPAFDLQLMNTHLSINWRERRAQIGALLGAEWVVQALKRHPLVVCGDFNSSPLSGIYRKLGRELRDVQRCGPRCSATWPAGMPFWRIDHIFVSPSFSVLRTEVPMRGLSRTASDHLPLLADLRLDSGAPAWPTS